MLSTQRPDGTWEFEVKSDVRATAFYLNTIARLGFPADVRTRQMESHLSDKQLKCGAWESSPGSGPDIEVTAVCALSLERAETKLGLEARSLAEIWLSKQPHPPVDSFWTGFLALCGYLDWQDVPYLTPRIVTKHDWLHPNIYDFSFLRIAVVSAILMQSNSARGAAAVRRSTTSRIADAYSVWRDCWIAKAKSVSGGALAFLSKSIWGFDQIFSVERNKEAAIHWLLSHQESDGSFFSSVHMTSIAIVALHTVDAKGYADQIQAGLMAMQQWQIVEGETRRQSFTDSTNWDTILGYDLLRRLGVPSSHSQMRRAESYIVSAQTNRVGDWSHRVKKAMPGGWGFQRVGSLYPDNDDTVMAVTALLEAGSAIDQNAIENGVRWLLSMQSSNGGWASWDRNDRPWIKIPNGGPWFARDLACSEITARVVVLLSRIVKGRYPTLEHLHGPSKVALRRGLRWLKRNEKAGIWYGVWFSHFLYGTSHVLEAYREVDLVAKDATTRRCAAWFVSVVNNDGGFGEALESGSGQGFVSAPSSAFHTACGLIGLVHSGASGHVVASQAAQWLVENQCENGSWMDKCFFAAGVPGLWYANFTGTSNYFAAKALSEYRRSQ